MCYSVESSLRTTFISLICIIYLLTSNIPKFQYLGAVLIGWCVMQFAEALIWMTDPTKCSITNRLLTIILIPIVLILQPLGSVWGSIYIEPWKKNKKFIISYSIFIISFLLIYRYLVVPYFFKYKDCTVITPQGHLDWSTTTTDYTKRKNNFDIIMIIMLFLWLILSYYPLFKFWKGKRLWPFYLIPLIGIFAGFYTDSPASIWCNITSYGSIAGALLLFLYKCGIDILE